MYKIRGADQKEYGPVTLETLRQWLKEGRLNGNTPVQPAGQETWTPLSSLPEFAAGAPAIPMAPALPPPLRAAAKPEAKTSSMAIASLVLAVLGFCSVGVTALAGLVLAIVALMKINRSEGRLKGRGLAIAAICVSALMAIYIPLLAALTLPALAQAKSKAQTVNCVNNLKQVGLAARIYATENGDKLPNAETWNDDLLKYVGQPSVYQCPAQNRRPQCSYGYNAKLSGKKDNEINPQTVMFFECRGGWNVSGGAQDMTSHHGRNSVVCLADGSVQQVSGGRMASLRWDP